LEWPHHQPYIEVGTQQLQGITSLHFDDLKRWLAVGWDSSGFLSQKKTSFDQTISDQCYNQAADEQEERLRHNGSMLSSSIVSTLNHIGRIDPDLAFLAKLAEIGESCQRQALPVVAMEAFDLTAGGQSSLPGGGASDLTAQTAIAQHVQHAQHAQHAQYTQHAQHAQHAHTEVANGDTPMGGVTNFFAQLLPQLLSNSARSQKHQPMLGLWKLCDRQNAEAFLRYEVYVA
jgi:hypothetical protein